ncbi:MAG: agmatine deiminase family protein [Muribaculaceae bacterium]|nr:agmatine deiminase family protein [Muribaculaceae bacterium]
MKRRLPAEWEHQESVLMAWPHSGTDWAYILPSVQKCYTEIAEAIVSHAQLIMIIPHGEEGDAAINMLSHLPQDRIRFCRISTNDTWARDFGPITVITGTGRRALDFQFNGWGLKFAANLDNGVTRRMWDSEELPAEEYENNLDFVLEGGSIESDGEGTILTTEHCLMAPNRNACMSRQMIEGRIKKSFGARRVLWLSAGELDGDDTDSHIDTLARLAPGNTIIYVGPDQGNPSYGNLDLMENQLKELRTDEGSPYNLIALPLPDPEYDEDGLRLPATYANFLILNDAVLLPVYNQPGKDLLAQQMLKIAFPEHKIYSIDCRALIQQHGSLHCVTMQLPCKNER